jgi:hypothetical protein
MSNTGDVLCGDHAFVLRIVVPPLPSSIASNRTTRPLRLAQNTFVPLRSIAIDVIASPSPSSRASAVVVDVVAASPRRVVDRVSDTPPSRVAHAYTTSSARVSRRAARAVGARVSRPSPSPSFVPSPSPPPSRAGVAIAIGAPRPT